MKNLKVVLVILPIIVLFGGCSKNSQTLSETSSTINTSTTSSSSFANYNVTTLYPDGIPTKQIITVDSAVNDVIDKFKASDNDDTRYSIESVELINNRIYYIVKRFEDKTDHIATIGYYAVDVFTSEVFDTHGLTDLTSIS